MTIPEVQTPAPGPAQPRAVGAARIAVRQAGGISRLADLRQEGSLKLLLPRRSGAAVEAVLLYTAGGLTGGDAMEVAALAEAEAQLVLTTQAAERAYRARPGPPARVRAHLTASEGARLHWLPQETLLYDGASLDRRLEVDLAAGASALLCEPLILGRTAMGEVVRQAALSDRWTLRREGRLLYHDVLRLTGDVAATFDRAAVGGGARALAQVALAAPGAGARAAEIRAMLPDAAGASAPDPDLLLIRLLAIDGFALRAALIPLLERLSGAPLPKVWRL
ncbi:urease accessory protein UreD [Pseudoroseicyclus aestuarii]|uniref:Urease accessory protein UreD n=1 Tax=Pseudoroseicyclus aestuarii TaxID=1795041 RepID=A0A318T6R1_9RHOB|nr:urease accessory protein UreD [Pseudoroseicyclus aestuarii]PYE84088.1 urease accessory protein [Pseudoroseicyclus aestuarii]